MPHQEGILDHQDWDEVKEDWAAKAAGAWHQSWRPVSQRPGHRILRALRSVFWPPAGPSSTSEGGPETKLRRTAWLDGLRGFAAFVVYWHHHQLWPRTEEQRALLENGFGRDGQYRLAAFPVARNLFSGGHFAVSAFFVISGYALSAKPLSLVHAGAAEQLGDNVASALFRRWLRLYIPLAATLLLYALSWHLLPGTGAHGHLWVRDADPQRTWRDEVWRFYAEFKNFSFVFNGGGTPWLSYSFHSWSIPAEFRGSVVIYTTLLALSRCARDARLACSAALVVYFLYIADGWYCALFVAGMLLADLDGLAARGELPRPLARLKPLRTFMAYHALLVSLYLGGVPSRTTDVADLARNRGWYYLSLLKPQAVFDYKWFYLFWAAVLLVASVPRVGWLRGFFETRFCQRLGRLSYALYLVHGPVLWTLGERVYAAVGWGGPEQQEHIPGWFGRLPLSQKGPMGLEMAFLVPHVVLLPVTFWLAELVTRFLDEPAVRFAQWLYGKTKAKPSPKA